MEADIAILLNSDSSDGMVETWPKIYSCGIGGLLKENFIESVHVCITRSFFYKGWPTLLDIISLD